MAKIIYEKDENNDVSSTDALWFFIYSIIHIGTGIFIGVLLINYIDTTSAVGIIGGIIALINLIYGVYELISTLCEMS